jgi:hypothetical protein
VAEPPEVFLRLFLVAPRIADRERAEQIVERLSARRPVYGEAGEWRLAYEASGVSAAMAMCAAELTELDPRWLEILDFAVLPARLILHARLA